MAFAGQVRAGRQPRAQEEAGRVSYGELWLSFCFSAGRAFLASTRKTGGKERGRIPPFGRSFSRMRGEIRQYADNRATPCGEKKCLLRQKMRALAESKRRFCGNFCQNLQTNVNKCMENPSLWGAKENVLVSKRRRTAAFRCEKQRFAFFLSFCHSCLQFPIADGGEACFSGFLARSSTWLPSCSVVAKR